MAMCYDPPLVRDKPLGAPASVKLIYLEQSNRQVTNPQSIPKCEQWSGDAR